MTAEIQTKPSGTKIQAYRCRQRATGREKCPRPMTVSGNLLEPHVTAVALEYLIGADLPYDVGRTAEELEPLREALADARYDLEQFEHTALSEGLKPSQVASMLAQYAARVEEAQAALDAASEPVGEALTLPREVVEQWDAKGTAARRELLREVFESITVRRGKERIEERTVFDWKLPLVAALPEGQAAV